MFSNKYKERVLSATRKDRLHKSNRVLREHFFLLQVQSMNGEEKYAVKKCDWCGDATFCFCDGILCEMKRQPNTAVCEHCDKEFGALCRECTTNRSPKINYETLMASAEASGGYKIQVVPGSWKKN